MALTVGLSCFSRCDVGQRLVSTETDGPLAWEMSMSDGYSQTENIFRLGLGLNTGLDWFGCHAELDSVV